MTAWLLLVLTLVFGVLTVDAFRMGMPLRELSARFWPREWKKGQEHLTLAEQDRLQGLRVWSTLGMGWLAWTWLAITILSAILTAQAFWL
jgi:hypothetical protein